MELHITKSIMNLLQNGFNCIFFLVKYTFPGLILREQFIVTRERKEDFHKEDSINYLIKYECCFEFSQELKKIHSRSQEMGKTNCKQWACLTLSVDLRLEEAESGQIQTETKPLQWIRRATFKTYSNR